MASKSAVLGSAATITVFLCPEEEGTVRGAPPRHHGAVSGWYDITNFAIVPYHIITHQKPKKEPRGGVSHVIVRIRDPIVEPPSKAV